MFIARLRHVRLDLGRAPVLTGVDLEVAAGERVGIAGPNGVGKTTLLSVLATLRSPVAGEGEVLGATLGTNEVYPVRPRIGWSGHEPALYDELTLSENLRHFARLSGHDLAAADEVLDRVGLGGAVGRRAGACSNGMRRRADLARLLMTRPDLVLLDEAQAGLDADAGMIVEAICRRAVGAGGAVVMVSHDPEALGRQVDRVVRMTEGRVSG